MRRILCEATRDAAMLVLRYRIEGDISAILLPRAAPERADGLWQGTCVEAFLAGADESYTELNMASSGAWAAYRFTRYRTGMTDLAIAAPAIVARGEGDALTIEARWAGAPLAATGRLGLAAVIEMQGGVLSYWALAHPPGAPDFHHRDCFAAELAPTTMR